MTSFTRYDIPPIILALLGVLLLLLGAGLGIDTVISMLTVPDHSGWVGVVMFIAGGAVFFGSVTTLFGVWFVYDPEFKLPTSIVSGILILGFVRLVQILELANQPREVYNTALTLSILLVPLLTWCLLWGVERHWNMSFSQRMGRW